MNYKGRRKDYKQLQVGDVQITTMVGQNLR